MAKGKNFGVLTMMLQGRDSGLTSTMNKASGYTAKFTGTLDGLNNTYSNLSSKLGLIAGGMTLATKAGTGLSHVFKLLTSSTDNYLSHAHSFQDFLTTLPLGLGEAARATFELGESFGIVSADMAKRLKAQFDVIAKVRKDIAAEAHSIEKDTEKRLRRAAGLAKGLTDADLKEADRIRELRRIASDKGHWDRWNNDREKRRDQLEKEFMRTGMSEGDAIDKSYREIRTLDSRLKKLNDARQKEARAELAALKKQKKAQEALAKVEKDRAAERKKQADTRAQELIQRQEKAKADRAEADRLRTITGLTRQRATAERELDNAQRMRLGDQFSFQGFIGTMRIADRADTSSLQLQHTEALQRVNATLVDINTKLEGMATA